MLQGTRCDSPGLKLGASVAERSKMIAWRRSGEGMGVGKAGERRGQKPPGAQRHRSKRRPYPAPSQSITFLPALQPPFSGPLWGRLGVDLWDLVTVTGHHRTCNMTQVKLKPAGRVPGPHPGASRLVPGPVCAASQTRAPLLHLQPHRSFLEGPGTGTSGMTLQALCF